MTDPSRHRAAIVLGSLIVLFSICCCAVTLLGWTRGALDALSLIV